MVNHPLTDEIIEEIQMRAGGPCERCNDDLNMRAAADWQLEQVIEWLEKKGLMRYVYGDSFAMIDTPEVIADLKQAMRPQDES